MYKSILFVEDEQLIAEMYGDVLGQAGFKVDLESDGLRGYELAATGEYDLVLLDLMLPSMTGLEILRRLRDTKQSPNFTPDHHVIILTNLEEDDKTKKEMDKLAQAYFMKVDITPHRLADTIKKMTSG